ncbi:Sec1 family domain-containing protein 1 [Nymphon striatum]|nr:Sec1 family domain-containing protein 1 [Nymphon striatum]
MHAIIRKLINNTMSNYVSAALTRMLNLNSPPTKASAEPVWKVLVYDRYGQDIISPLLSVKELREMGITLHMLIHSDREAIPDVPAIYFIMPTVENISRISQDLQNQLYDNYYLNFISAVARQKLEDLASAAVHSSSVVSVSKVFDQYLNFITLEEDMFTLRHQGRDALSYYAINKGDVKDTEIENIMDSIVDSLFSVFVTLGTIPIIRSPKGNAAEMVAEKLDKKIRENLRDSRNSLFTSDSMTGQFSFQRPVLIILDRNIDMATPLHHTWTYQALAHDVLELQLNRVTVEEETENLNGAKSRKKIKAFDLNVSDKFWIQHKGSPFPTVAEAVQEELENYRASEDEVKRLKSAMGLDGESDEAITMISDTTAKLTSAISSLPELLEKKRLIDMHTTIATAILDHIKSRKLDIYFEVEEKIMAKTTLDKSLMDMFADPESNLNFYFGVNNCMIAAIFQSFS